MKNKITKPQAALRELGFTRVAARTWQLIHDATGPLWYVVTVTLSTMPEEPPIIRMAGTREGHRLAIEVRRNVKRRLRLSNFRG